MKTTNLHNVMLRLGELPENTVLDMFLFRIEGETKRGLNFHIRDVMEMLGDMAERSGAQSEMTEVKSILCVFMDKNWFENRIEFNCKQNDKYNGKEI
jgi:hypothetical protein